MSTLEQILETQSRTLGYPQPTLTWVVFDPSKAQEFLNNYEYIGQRPVRYSHIAVLADVMTESTFDPYTPLRLVKLPDGRIFLIDGQHRLRSIVKSDLTYAMLVMTYIVSDEETVAKIYARLDRGRGRSVAEGMRNFEDQLTALGLTRTQATQLSAAVPILESGFTDPGINTAQQKSVEKRVDAAFTYCDLGKEFFVSIKDCRKVCRYALTRRSTIAMGLAMFQDAPNEAYSFWNELARDDGLAHHDPRKQCLIYLTEKTNSVVKERSIEQCRAIGYFWSKFLNGEKILSARPPKEGAVVIEGTRFNGTGTDRLRVEKEMDAAKPLRTAVKPTTTRLPSYNGTTNAPTYVPEQCII